MLLVVGPPTTPHVHTHCAAACANTLTAARAALCCAAQAGVRAIAGEARKKGVGARGLRSIMERLLLDAMFHVSAGLTLCSAFVVVFMALEGRQVVSWERWVVPLRHGDGRRKVCGRGRHGIPHCGLSTAAAPGGQPQCDTDSRLLRPPGALHASLCVHLHPPNTRPASQPASQWSEINSKP